jgi:hypothetical protein
LSILTADDFPLAQVGNLIVSQRRREPVLVASSVPIARQVAFALNVVAAQDAGFSLSLEPWLVLQ